MLAPKLRKNRILTEIDTAVGALRRILEEAETAEWPHIYEMAKNHLECLADFQNVVKGN